MPRGYSVATRIASAATDAIVRAEPTLVYGWVVRGPSGLVGVTVVTFYDGSDNTGNIIGFETVQANATAHIAFVVPVNASDGVFIERSGNAEVVLYHEDD